MVVQCIVAISLVVETFNYSIQDLSYKVVEFLDDHNSNELNCNYWSLIEVVDIKGCGCKIVVVDSTAVNSDNKDYHYDNKDQD